MRRAHTYALVLALALAALLAAGCGGSDDETVGAGSVAVVDGTEIPKAQFDELVSSTKTQFKNEKRDFPKVGTAEYKSLQSTIVVYLVRRTQNEKEAAELGVAVTDADLKKRIEEVTAQFGGKKEFQEAVKQQGLTIATVEDQLRAQLLSQKLVEQLTEDVAVTEADARKYYDENKSQFIVPESREVRHILLAVKKGDKVNFEKSRAQADEVYRQLAGGADFAVLAKKLSQDLGSKESGGKLTITKGQTVPPFEKASFTLKTKTISQPVKTQFGYHLIEPLADVKKEATSSFADVKAQIEAQLSDTKRNELVEKWAKDVDKKYEDKIAYADGYAPPPTATATTTTG